MAVSYKKLIGPTPRQNNVGGTTQRFFFAPIDYFTTIQKVKDLSDSGATSETEFVEISTDHVFAVDKGFHQLYCTRDMGSVKQTSVGERDGRGYKIEGELFLPGYTAETLAFGVMAKNDRWIILVEMADGQLLQAGTEQFPAECKFDFDAAKNESGVRGTKITFNAFAAQPTVYSGALEISTT